MALQNLFGDLALDATVQSVLAELVTMNAAVADLDVNTDGIEALLTAIQAAIGANDTAALEALVTAGNALLATIDTNVADIETLATTANALATTLNAQTDTVEALLATIDGRVDELEALATTLNAQTDQLETLIAATNATLTTIDGRVDGLETLVAATNTALATVITHVDGLEGLLTTISGTLTTIDSRVDGVEALLTTIDGRVDGLEGLATLTNTKLDTVIAAVDELEALQTSANALLTTANGPVKAEDAAAASADPGLAILGVRNDADAVRTSADGDYGMIALDSAGRVKIAGTVAATGGLTNAELRATPVPTVESVDATSPAGMSAYRNISTLNTGVSIKGSAGKLYTITMINNQALDRFVKLYNVAGVPTAADVPIFTFGLSQTDGFQMVTFEGGVAFPLGIGIRATTGVADADNGAPGANQVIVNVGFR